MIRSKPVRASSIAIPRPIPRDAPVTSATRCWLAGAILLLPFCRVKLSIDLVGALIDLCIVAIANRAAGFVLPLLVVLESHQRRAITDGDTNLIFIHFAVIH